MKLSLSACFLPVTKSLSCQDVDCRPTYFKAAATDAKACGDRAKMLRYYQEDVKSWWHLNKRIPAHTPFNEQTSGTSTIRAMSWNINNLCGLSPNISTTTSEQCVALETIVDVIRDSGADIVVLQEALADPKDCDDKACEVSCEYKT